MFCGMLIKLVVLVGVLSIDISMIIDYIVVMGVIGLSGRRL